MCAVSSNFLFGSVDFYNLPLSSDGPAPADGVGVSTEQSAHDCLGLASICKSN